MRRVASLGILVTLLFAMMFLGCGEQENIMSPQSFEELQPTTLAAPKGPSPQACLNLSLSPSSIDISKPQALAFIQISGKVTIGDCGLIICSDTKYESWWEKAPGTGAIEIGPIPPGNPQGICQGGTDSFKQLLIITRAVPSGSYVLRFKVSGFGGYITRDLNVTIR